ACAAERTENALAWRNMGRSFISTSCPPSRRSGEISPSVGGVIAVGWDHPAFLGGLHPNTVAKWPIAYRILRTLWLVCGRSGRLAPWRHVPEAEAKVGACRRGDLAECAAVILFVRADGINHHAIVQATIAQRLAVIQIERQLHQERRHEVRERTWPSVVGP